MKIEQYFDKLRDHLWKLSQVANDSSTSKYVLLSNCNSEHSEKIIKFFETYGVPSSFFEFLIRDAIRIKDLKSLQALNFIFISDLKHFCKFKLSDFEVVFNNMKKDLLAYSLIADNSFVSTLIDDIISNYEFFKDALLLRDAYQTSKPLDRAQIESIEYLRELSKTSVFYHHNLELSDYFIIKEAVDNSENPDQASKNIIEFAKYTTPSLLNVETVLFVANSSQKTLNNIKQIVENNLDSTYSLDQLKELTTKDDIKKKHKFNF